MELFITQTRGNREEGWWIERPKPGGLAMRWSLGAILIKSGRYWVPPNSPLYISILGLRPYLPMAQSI